MHNISPSVKFFVNLGKAQSILNHRFDRGLGGLGFSEFLILYYLDQADNQKMRRVDLADKIGMTASGVTRLLLPMEKVHLIKSGPEEKDARVRFVISTAAGKQKLAEALERLGDLAEEIVPVGKAKDVQDISDLLIEIAGRALVA